MSEARNYLSSKDQAVLESIFNPFEIGANGTNTLNIFNCEVSDNLEDPQEPNTPEVLESIKYEFDGIKLAESGNLDEALGVFEKAIRIAPNRSSPYNNRAQAYRLKSLDEDALADLNRAIELSSSSGRTGCKALCQRGILYRKKENLDLARQDFEIAAKLGSKYARTQLIEINPYAALCNQMLKDVFQKLT